MTKRSRTLLISGTVLAAMAGQAMAQVTIFSDNFNRADSRNIQASLTGITDNTGSSLAAGSVYTLNHIDPNNAAPTFGVQDGNAANGGGAQILNNQLQLATGAGTSEATVNHNFINSSILSAGGFSVSLDVNGYNQGAYQFGGAFAIGMSASEAASAGDAFDLLPSMTGAFHDSSTIGATVGGTVVGANVLSDFWLALRGNGTMVWGSGVGSTIQGATGLTKTGTISANFWFSDFNAGSTVNYEVFYNGASKGTGAFVWSGTDENYIGIDARDNIGVNMDNFIISVPEPSVTALGLLAAAGWLIRRRKA